VILQYFPSFLLRSFIYCFTSINIKPVDSVGTWDLGLGTRDWKLSLPLALGAESLERLTVYSFIYNMNIYFKVVEVQIQALEYIPTLGRDTSQILCTLYSIPIFLKERRCTIEKLKMCHEE
jgi:hypothetical protein